MNTIAFRVLALVALAIGLIGFGGIVTAHDEATPVGSPMAGEMPMQGMGGTGASYMVIENAGAGADHLIGGSTDVADVVEIHEMFEENDVMVMRPVAGGIEVPAGGLVTLEPGGYHVMLIGLTRDLTDGMIFDLTLTFEQAGDVVVPVTVQHAAPEDDAIVSIEAGDLTISGVWSRPAPALLGTPEASPMASPTM